MKPSSLSCRAYLAVASMLAALDMEYAHRSGSPSAYTVFGMAPSVPSTAIFFVGPARRRGRKAAMPWTTPRALILYFRGAGRE